MRLSMRRKLIVRGCSVIAVENVAREETRRYGIVSVRGKSRAIAANGTKTLSLSGPL